MYTLVRSQIQHVPSHLSCGLRHSWLSSIEKQKIALSSKLLPIYTYNTKGVLH